MDKTYEPAIDAGYPDTVGFYWTADKCGDIQVKAVIDATDSVEESNEENNERVETVDVECPPKEKPDLISQDIWWSPSNPKQGDTLTINVKTKNQGSENAGGFYVCYYVDGSYYTRDYVSSLSAGSTTTTSFSWTADCGSHAIKAVADCYDAVTESDEENNWRSKGGLNIPCNPDLIIQDISWSPSSPKMGDTVTINIITKNQGSGNTGGFYVCYYVDGSYYDRDYVSSLSDGSTTTTSFSWTAECGNHAIKAVADCYNAVAESNEGNNWRSKGGLNIPSCKSDLIIQDIFLSPSNPKEGETVTFTIKTKNQGSENAGGFYVGYYVDGSYYDRDYVSSLSAGSTATTSFTTSLTWTVDEKGCKCGSILMKTVADCYNAVAESNETNNDYSYQSSITYCIPDLIIQDISWSPSNPKEGDTVTINVKTKNQGSGNAGGFYVCYYVDGSYYDRGYVSSSLSAGSTTTTSFTWTADCGSHATKAVADCYNAVVESDEENNWMSKGGLNIPCNPDLIVQDISWSPSNPKEGDDVEFTIIVENQGKGRADESWLGFKFFPPKGIPVGSEVRLRCPPLGSGETASLYDTITLSTCGKYTFKATADARKDIKESREDNNEKTAIINIECPAKKPDLFIQDISWKPKNPKQGDNVEFAVTVKNIGKGIAEESHVFIYDVNWDAGKVLFKIKDSCPSLKPGETYTYHKNVKIEDCGEYDLMAWADAQNEVNESNEENNYKDASFTVPCPKEEGTLVVNVYSIDGKPAAEVKGPTTVELIKSGDVSPTAKQSIDDKSRVTFTDIPIGNYYINVYQNPQLEQGSKEFWGKRKDISITAGKTTTIDFYRYNPYVDKFYAEKKLVEANTPVKINVGIKVPSNCPDAEAYVKALVIIRDESGHEVYRGVSDDRKVQKGGSTTFSFSYTPANEGTYYGLAKAYIVGGGELCTDNCGWMKVFTCSKEESDLFIQDIAWKPKNPESEDPVDFTITVKNAGTKDVDSAICVDFETGATQQPRKKVADSLKSGETATVTYNGILKKYCLSYLAQATVDPDNTIAESDENNNYKAETVDIAMKYALIVGINNYEDKEISQLDTAVRYANKMKKLLISGYNYDEVKLLTEEDATKHTIGEYLTQFSEKVDSNDIFVFYFFGHGTNNTYHKEEIVAHDLHRLSDEDFVEISNNFKGTVICIFESCNSGGMAYDTDNSNGKTGIDRDNAIVLMSCQANEDSYENKIRFFPWLSDAIYPKYLYEAFVNKRQDVDKNNDGKIALEEAHNYAWKKTIAFADSHGKSQHPQIMDHYKSKSHPEAYCYFSRHPINPEFINE